LNLCFYEVITEKCRGTAPCVLEHDSIWRYVIKFTTLLLFPTVYPFNRRITELMCTSDALEKKKILSQPKTENQFLDYPHHSLVTIMTELLRVPGWEKAYE
jgi:hypothetical protein